MSYRLLKVNQLIKRELSQIILKEIEFPSHVLVTLTRVETSSNLIVAKVYIAVIPEEQTADILKILNQNIFELQHKLNKRLNMRPVPKIKFIEEKKTSEAGRIEKILQELKKRKNKLNL